LIDLIVTYNQACEFSSISAILIIHDEINFANNKPCRLKK